MDGYRAAIGSALERGALRSVPSGRALEAIYARLAAPRIARPLRLPSGVRVVGVGSAVLGGAGKTPLCEGLSIELAKGGERVAVVAHAYRAAVGSPRVVRPHDEARAVGDDALTLARRLDPLGIEVFVGPSRQAALDAAARSGATTVVVDGLLQAAPGRLARSLLVLDADAPWGADACPPRGDLRAPRGALLAVADTVVVLRDALSTTPSEDIPTGAVVLTSRCDAALDAHGAHHDLASLRGLRVGLVIGVARSDRVHRTLARRGIVPATTLAFGDHARFHEADGRARRVNPHPEIWLTTPRCATKLPSRLAGAPVLALDHRVDASPLSRGWA